MPAFAEKVASVACTQCGRSVDLAGQEPLDTIDCPHCGAALIVPGIVGTLTLQRILGRGTAGIVYEAFDSELQRKVAVKVFFRQKGQDAEAHIEKCLAEARAMRALHHTNVVEIYRVAQKGERPFIVMELLTGDRLDKVIAEKWLIEEPRALRMAIDIASGLKAVHDAGFVHLDVKPANIQMAGDGTCKLLDYDQALSVRQIEEKGGAGLVGTPYYVAPEIITHGSVDFRADMFSLGATLFHLMAQRPPFQGDNSRDVVQERLRRKAMSLGAIRPDVSAETANILGRMLEPDPDDRYATYDTLLADLNTANERAVERIMEAEAKKAQAKSPMNRVAILACVALLLIAGVIFALTRGGGTAEQPVVPNQNGTNTNGQTNKTIPPVPVDPNKDRNIATAFPDPTKDRSVTPVLPDPVKDGKAVVDPPPDPVKPGPVKPVDPVKPEVIDPTPREVAAAGGWKGVGDVKLTWSPRLLTVWGLSEKPQLVLENVKLPVKAGEAAVVELRIKAGGAGKGRLHWKTAGDKDWDPARSREIELKHDDQVREYFLPFKAAGDVTDLRIDLGEDSGIFEIVSIQYFTQSADKQPAKAWRFEKP